MDALLIVDFQNDFTPGGALAVAGGDEIAEPLAGLLDRFDLVVATRDWHPPDHASFEGTWPVHCVEGTAGAELQRTLGSMAWRTEGAVQPRLRAMSGGVWPAALASRI